MFNRNNRRSSTAGIRIHIGNPWHAVSVCGGVNRCNAVAALEKQRFLAREAPLTPLRDCSNAADCRCTFQHFDDRRSGPRRATDEGLPERPLDRQERRRAPGRRLTDRR
jgi:hypothetical protein